MRRLLAICLFVSLIFSSCSPTQSVEKTPQKQKLVGVWLTYYELAAFKNSPLGLEGAIDEMVNNCDSIGINTIFVQVRAFCDAAYKSEIFPSARYLDTGEEDLLSLILNAAKKRGISVHAWINPYRVSTSGNNVGDLPENSPARRWLEDNDPDNDKNVCLVENGIYLNPAESQVQDLILKGVRELLNNYDVDGIHIDDYFYPTDNTEFDVLSYNKYKQNASIPLDLAEWRRQNVSNLIKAIYCAVKAKDKALVFGVSPAADIDRCYNTLYADVEAWLDGKYIDYIMPQLYFGFKYPDQRYTFDSLLTLWLDMVQNKSASLCVGLANYKIGTEQEPDKAEWNSETDIISRQIDLLVENGVESFCFFSYSAVFSENSLNKTQTQNIKIKLEEIK